MLRRAQLNRCALRTGPHRRDLAGEPAVAQPLQHGRGVAGRAGRRQHPLVQPQVRGQEGDPAAVLLQRFPSVEASAQTEGTDPVCLSLS